MPSSRPLLMYSGGGDSVDSGGNNNYSLQLLRFGMDVAEYQEKCRYIQSLLWVDSTTSTSIAGPSSLSVLSSSSSVAAAAASELTTKTTTAIIVRLVRDVWKEASKLLHNAIQISCSDTYLSLRRVGCNSNHINISNSNSNSVVSRSVETLCDHIEYIITRQRRSRRTRLSHSLSSCDKKKKNNNNDECIRVGNDNGNGNGNGNGNDNGNDNGNKDDDCGESVTKNLSTTPIVVVKNENNDSTKEYNYDYCNNLPANHQRDPPPIDLFDMLLIGLRSLTLCRK